MRFALIAGLELDHWLQQNDQDDFNRHPLLTNLSTSANLLLAGNMVASGDITSYKTQDMIGDFTASISRKYHHVVTVPGVKDLRGDVSLAQAIECYHHACSDIIPLYNESILLAYEDTYINIHGTTLWTHPDKRVSGSKYLGLNTNLKQVKTWHQSAVTWLITSLRRTRLQSKFNIPNLVLSHHCPSLSVGYNPVYIQHPDLTAYACSVADRISVKNKPDYWCYGNTNFDFSGYHNNIYLHGCANLCANSLCTHINKIKTFDINA